MNVKPSCYAQHQSDIWQFGQDKRLRGRAFLHDARPLRRRSLVFIRNPKWKQDARKTEGLPISTEVLGILSALCQQAKGGRLFWYEGNE